MANPYDFSYFKDLNSTSKIQMLTISIIWTSNLNISRYEMTSFFNYLMLYENTVLLLTPEGQRSFFSKKCSNRPFLAQEAQTKK
jgi:hypothetical protein